MSAITQEAAITSADSAAVAGAKLKASPASQVLAGATAQRAAIGLGILRVVLGIVFAAHGAQKLFLMGLPGLTEGFAAMGIPLAGVAAPAVALLEFIGGLALIGGLFVVPVAIGLTVVMVGALFFAHLPAGFFLPNGYEFVMTLAAGAIALALAGPGAWSLDGLRAQRKQAK